MTETLKNRGSDPNQIRLSIPPDYGASRSQSLPAIVMILRARTIALVSP